MIAADLRTFVSSLLLLSITASLLANSDVGETDPVLASVDNQPIRLSYVYQRIESLPLGDQIDVRDQLDRFTDSVINEEILFQYALRQLEKDTKFRDQIKTVLLSQLIDSQVKSRINIPDKLVRTYYRENSGDGRTEHWRVHHIPLNTGEQCEALIPLITSLVSFVDLASKYSTDPLLASRGGDLGYLMRQHNLLDMGESLFTLPLNETHRIDYLDTCHLVWISEYKKLPVPELDEVRDQIHQILVRQQEVSLLKTLLEKASEEIVVKRYSFADKAADETVMSDATVSGLPN